jgi:hypothetical protein
MPKIYKRNCDCCGRFYQGQSDKFCSNKCCRKLFIPWNKNLTKESDERLKIVAEKISTRNKKHPIRFWLGKKRPGIGIKISLANKGKKAWNKGFTKENNERVLNNANSLKGRKSTCYWTGKKRLHMSGEKHWFWKGGVTEQNHLIRQSPEYKNWRRSVYIRDEYTCQECRHKNVRIVAHHIKPFAEFIDLRFDVDNGITLCRNCHARLELSLRQGDNYVASNS